MTLSQQPPPRNGPAPGAIPQWNQHNNEDTWTTTTRDYVDTFRKQCGVVELRQKAYTLQDFTYTKLKSRGSQPMVLEAWIVVSLGSRGWRETGGDLREPQISCLLIWSGSHHTAVLICWALLSWTPLICAVHLRWSHSFLMHVMISLIVWEISED